MEGLGLINKYAIMDYKEDKKEFNNYTMNQDGLNVRD